MDNNDKKITKEEKEEGELNLKEFIFSSRLSDNTYIKNNDLTFYYNESIKRSLEIKKGDKTVTCIPLSVKDGAYYVNINGNDLEFKNKFQKALNSITDIIGTKINNSEIEGKTNIATLKAFLNNTDKYKELKDIINGIDDKNNINYLINVLVKNSTENTQKILENFIDLLKTNHINTNDKVESLAKIFDIDEKLTSIIKEQKENNFIFLPPIPENIDVEYFKDCLDKLENNSSLRNTNGELWKLLHDKCEEKLVSLVFNNKDQDYPENIKNGVLQKIIEKYFRNDFNNFYEEFAKDENPSDFMQKYVGQLEKDNESNLANKSNHEEEGTKKVKENESKLKDTEVTDEIKIKEKDGITIKNKAKIQEDFKKAFESITEIENISSNLRDIVEKNGLENESDIENEINNIGFGELHKLNDKNNDVWKIVSEVEDFKKKMEDSIKENCLNPLVNEKVNKDEDKIELKALLYDDNLRKNLTSNLANISSKFEMCDNFIKRVDSALELIDLTIKKKKGDEEYQKCLDNYKNILFQNEILAKESYELNYKWKFRQQNVSSPTEIVNDNNKIAIFNEMSKKIDAVIEKLPIEVNEGERKIDALQGELQSIKNKLIENKLGITIAEIKEKFHKIKEMAQMEFNEDNKKEEEEEKKQKKEEQKEYFLDNLDQFRRYGELFMKTAKNLLESEEFEEFKKNEEKLNEQLKLKMVENNKNRNDICKKRQHKRKQEQIIGQQKFLYVTKENCKKSSNFPHSNLSSIQHNKNNIRSGLQKKIILDRDYKKKIPTSLRMQVIEINNKQKKIKNKQNNLKKLNKILRLRKRKKINNQIHDIVNIQNKTYNNIAVRKQRRIGKFNKYDKQNSNGISMTNSYN